MPVRVRVNSDITHLPVQRLSGSHEVPLVAPQTKYLEREDCKI